MDLIDDHLTFRPKNVEHNPLRHRPCLIPVEVETVPSHVSVFPNTDCWNNHFFDPMSFPLRSSMVARCFCNASIVEAILDYCPVEDLMGRKASEETNVLAVIVASTSPSNNL
eukprot:scaffold3126_cov46-Attheya_sp.AAC.3